MYSSYRRVDWDLVPSVMKVLSIDSGLLLLHIGQVGTDADVIKLYNSRKCYTLKKQLRLEIDDFVNATYPSSQLPKCLNTLGLGTISSKSATRGKQKYFLSLKRGSTAVKPLIAKIFRNYENFRLIFPTSEDPATLGRLCQLLKCLEIGPAARLAGIEVKFQQKYPRTIEFALHKGLIVKTNQEPGKFASFQKFKWVSKEAIPNDWKGIARQIGIKLQRTKGQHPGFSAEAIAEDCMGQCSFDDAMMALYWLVNNSRLVKGSKPVDRIKYPCYELTKKGRNALSTWVNPILEAVNNLGGNHS